MFRVRSAAFESVMETVEQLRREAALRSLRYWGSCRGCSGSAWFSARRTPERLFMRLVFRCHGVLRLCSLVLSTGTLRTGLQAQLVLTTSSPLSCTPRGQQQHLGLFRPWRHLPGPALEQPAPPRGSHSRKPEAPGSPCPSGHFRWAQRSQESLPLATIWILSTPV